MNKWIGMGRLTRDPEVRYSQSGSVVANFSVAIDRRYKRDGETTADFFNCTAFGKTGEFVEKYLRKGIKVVIEGELQNNNYEDKNGTKHYSVQIIVNQIEFAESKSSQANSNDTAEPEANAPADDGFMNIPDGIDEELPFA
nr:MAG TPA: Single strand binding protein [Caudoviricetes sp.]